MEVTCYFDRLDKRRDDVVRQLVNLVESIHQFRVAGSNPARHAKDRSSGVMETHWEEDIIALHPHVAGVCICKRVCPAVANMLWRIRIRVGYSDEILVPAVRVCLKELLLIPLLYPLVLN